MGKLDGKKVAFLAWPSSATALDNGLVSSRKPDDLPAFCDKMAEEICEGRHASNTPA